MIDNEKLKEAARLVIEAVGDDPKREGLLETPERFASMMAEMLSYAAKSNEEIASEFGKVFDAPESELVTEKDIEIFSFCEHHLALMYNMKVAVGYKPAGKIIGLSKIARICDAVGRRLQVQERIGADIRDVLCRCLDTEDIIVVIDGEHSCMTARGIKKTGTSTRTVTASGIFKESAQKQMFLSMI